MWLERIPTLISHGMNDMEKKSYRHSKSSMPFQTILLGFSERTENVLKSASIPCK